MISYRNADILDRFKPQTIIGTVRVVKQFFGTRRCITGYVLNIKTSITKERVAVVRFFESVYESLPSDIKDAYEANALGFVSPFGGDEILTIVSIDENGRGLHPNPQYITIELAARLIGFGIKNRKNTTEKVQHDSQRSIETYVACNFDIRWSDIPESFKQ